MAKTDPRLTKALVKLLIKHRFYGVLASSLIIKEDPNCETMATDSKHLFYAPKFLDAITPEQLKGVVVHELKHCVHLHATRRKHRDPEFWNMACDYAINTDILEAGFELPPGGLTNYAYHNMSAEEIYSKLKLEKVPLSKCPWGEVRDSDNLEEQKSKTETEWKVRIKQAAATAAKGHGSLPADVQRILDLIDKPVIDWRQELRKFIDDRVTTETQWSSPNKRYMGSGFVFPGMVRDGISKIGVAIDTSGSIDQKALAKFYAELQDILDCGLVKEVISICCDAAVQGPPISYQAGDTIDRDLKGGGGTRFSPAIDWFNKNEPEITALLYFTDLECSDFGPEPEYSVVWVVFENPVWSSPLFSRRKIVKPAPRTAPFGTTISLKEEAA